MANDTGTLYAATENGPVLRFILESDVFLDHIGTRVTGLWAHRSAAARTDMAHFVSSRSGNLDE